jgi:hypothetical protein
MQQKVKSDRRERAYWLVGFYSVHAEEVKGTFSRDGCAEGLRNLCHVLIYVTLHAFFFYFVFGSSFAFFNSTTCVVS